SALCREGRQAGGRVAIFDPFVKISSAIAAQVHGKIRLGANQPAEMHELIRAEFIWIIFSRAIWCALKERGIDPEIGAPGALAARANAISPIVTIGKTPARPATHGGFNAPHAFDKLGANALLVGDL